MNFVELNIMKMFFAFSLLRRLLYQSGIEEGFDKACPSSIIWFLGVLFSSQSTEKRLD
jgi:hypothetical protein